MNCLKKIVWDWNGTLLDDVQLCFECINRLLMHHDLPTLSSLESYRNKFGFPIEEYYQRIGFDFEKIPFSILAHEYMEDYQEKSYSCALHADALQVISKADDLGICQTVLSASKMDYLLKQMNILHVQNAFDSIYGIQDIYAKSKVDLAKKFKQTCSTQDEIWFVGDSLHDYEVSQSVDANCVLVSTGHQSIQQLSHAAVPIFDSLTESLDYIYETNNGQHK